MQEIVNPILTGFHPDPSILRVGDDYYIAVSTFEWYPGVLIYHSRDLVHWRLKAAPLNRPSLLELRGVGSSEGVWAPCLSHADGLFYLVYTVVRRWGYGGPRDLNNYVTTCESVDGEWSDPVFLNSSGFDPSLFHDSDGRKWLVNMCWDHRPGHENFAGILLQEYSVLEKRLTGPVKNIYKGTSLGWVEGPHLYKKDGYYYLLTAEGGTGFHHAVTLARATSLFGPYETHPDNPVMTCADSPECALQKAGHGSLVETRQGEWYMAHLCARPLPSRGRCILGRETALQRVVWKNGWLYLEQGGREPFVSVKAPALPVCEWEKEPERDDFDGEKLSLSYQSLRVPVTEDWLSLRARPGYVRLRGRESLGSRFDQSLLARRQQDFCYEAQTEVEFEPDSFFQMAGLTVLYDINNFFYLHVTYEEGMGKVIRLTSCRRGIYESLLPGPIDAQGRERIYFRAVMRFDVLRLFYSFDGEEWVQAGGSLDSSVLSDDYMEPLQFTGAFVGICCQDLSGGGKYADFDYFTYRRL